jgi:hypothetical protein
MPGEAFAENAGAANNYHALARYHGSAFRFAVRSIG